MTLAEVITAVRNETGHDLPDQEIDDTTVLTPWINLAFVQLRRKLTAEFPDSSLITSGTTVLTGATQAIAKPANFERLERLEKLFGDIYIPVPRAQPFAPEQEWYLGFREEGSNFVVSPVGIAPGTYRMVYMIQPPVAYDATLVPEGFEDWIVQKVCVKVCKRTSADPKAFQDEADRIWQEQVDALKTSPLGSAPVPGFVSVNGF